MQYQLRDFRIAPGNMQQWVNEWTERVVPRRAEAGFVVVGAWSNENTNRFVWILAHEGDFEHEDRAYYASRSRKDVSPDPARFIEEARAEFVEPVL